MAQSLVLTEPTLEERTAAGMIKEIFEHRHALQQLPANTEIQLGDEVRSQRIYALLQDPQKTLTSLYHLTVEDPTKIYATYPLIFTAIELEDLPLLMFLTLKTEIFAFEWGETSLSLDTPLRFATIRGKLNALNTLLLLDADPNACSTGTGRTPLMCAVDQETEQLEIVKRLCESPNIDVLRCKFYSSFNAVELAITRKHPHIILFFYQFLIENKSKETSLLHRLFDAIPLLIAANAGAEDVVIQKLAHGAIHEEVDQDGKTLLHIAAEHGWEDVVEGILSYIKTQKNTTDFRDKQCTKQGYTAMHYAVRNGHASTVGKLVEYSAADYIQSHDGKTPLHLAMIHGEPDNRATVRHLLRSLSVISCFSLADQDGLKPIDYATKHNKISYAEMIQMHAGYPTEKNTQRSASTGSPYRVMMSNSSEHSSPQPPPDPANKTNIKKILL